MSRLGSSLLEYGTDRLDLLSPLLPIGLQVACESELEGLGNFGLRIDALGTGGNGPGGWSRSARLWGLWALGCGCFPFPLPSSFGGGVDGGLGNIADFAAAASKISPYVSLVLVEPLAS